jgi:hypothetical protein
VVDEMLARYIDMSRIDLPISRIGNGNYMFGSKKIFAKVMNNKLVVRVGGGYMNMEEFINTYAESERLKLQHMDPEAVEALHNQNLDKRVIDTNPLSKRAGSPALNRGSPKASMAGSPRGSPRRGAAKMGGSFVGSGSKGGI